MSAQDSPPIPGPGEIIAGRYQVASVLGRGGGGVVYQATQLGVERDVAIKILPPESQLHNAAVRRFEREARLVSRLGHPNTVTLYEFNRTDAGLLYIVMEFVDGVPLKTVLRGEGSIPPVRAVPILRQILKSLAEAHAHGIVHRDLKPANIMLSNLYGEKDFVKVLDFGVATVLESEDNKFDEDVTVTADVVGTPKYMAPEQFRSGTLTPASDLYAWACIAFEMLAGYSPFDGETLHVTIAKHLFQPAPRMADVLPEFPRLAQIVDRLLSKDPNDRHQRAEDVLEALESWDSGSVEPSPSITPSRPSYATLHQATYDEDRTRVDATPEPGFDSGSSSDFPLIGDTSARMKPEQVAQMANPGFTNTPSFPVYSNTEDNLSDTDPNLMVLPNPGEHRPAGSDRGSESHRIVLLAVVAAVVILAGVAAVLVLTRGDGEESGGEEGESAKADDTAADDDDETVEEAAATEAPRPGLEGFSADELDQINLLHFVVEQGRIAANTAVVDGIYRTPRKAAPHPSPRQASSEPETRHVSIQFDYTPSTATVKVSKGRKRCRDGHCTIKAREGDDVTIKVSAEGRATRTKRVKANEDKTLDAIKLFRRTNR